MKLWCMQRKNKEYRWGARGVFVGAIIAVTYDIAQYGLTHEFNPPIWEGVFFIKALAFAIAVGIGVFMWKRFDKKAQEDDTEPIL
jgi:hypothetical protein